MKLSRLTKAWRIHRNLRRSLARYPDLDRSGLRLSYLVLLEAAGLDLRDCRDTATLGDYLVASGGVS